MPIVTRPIRYAHGGIIFEAFATWDDAAPGPRPLVLVAGTFMGRSRFEEGKARSLAELGYVGVAIDVYGVDHWPADADQARARMATLDADRAELKARLRVALDAALAADAPVDRAKVAAIGFCFGGKCVLDLARSGAGLAGVVSFHGLYDAPPFPNEAISAKILALHGWEDPLAPPDAVLGLASEMTEAGADWQLHAYGHTVHAFTNPAREGMYSPAADARSWQAMRNFLNEIFA
ncbi:dienelactone hydrolase family protein [Sphingomonas sp. SRS2]|uniref:dienelactone hydrolase family protein n=1 Tax=Sphingomonas sp. SRS2 TaxID=133190 RepID=UPI00061846D8|nr:dienelactone hydrolase family protein [Sphingomonas sp. SRS2]KKC25498.1 carboxymethylenebutenolidase [Sphingomonas sp. SRS2]